MKYPLTLPEALNQHPPLYMRVHPTGDQHVSAEIRERGSWEPYETRLLCEILSPGDCFVDVGANIGYYSVLGAAAVGGAGRVFAFEPEPANFALLESNIQLNKFGNVLSCNAGLSAENATARLYLSDSNWGDHQIYQRGEDRQSISIELMKGDDFLGNQIDRINVLKIDTQGAEFQVLSGLDKTIRASLPDIHIIIEFWPFGLKKAGAHGHQLLDLIESLDLPIWMIDHIGHSLHACSISELRDWVDALDNCPEDEGFFNLLIGNRNTCPEHK